MKNTCVTDAHWHEVVIDAAIRVWRAEVGLKISFFLIFRDVLALLYHVPFEQMFHTVQLFESQV